MNSFFKFMLCIIAFLILGHISKQIEKIEAHTAYMEKYFKHQELIDMELDSTIFQIDSLYDRRYNSIDSIESCTPDSN